MRHRYDSTPKNPGASGIRTRDLPLSRPGSSTLEAGALPLGQRGGPNTDPIPPYFCLARVTRLRHMFGMTTDSRGVRLGGRGGGGGGEGLEGEGAIPVYRPAGWLRTSGNNPTPHLCPPPPLTPLFCASASTYMLVFFYNLYTILFRP